MKANILPLKPELLEATLGFKYRQRSSPTIHKMPRQSTATQTRLKTITECLTMTANTLEVLADDLKIPLLVTISNTTQSLLKCIQTIKQNKNDCADLMEKIYNLLNAIILVHIESDTGGELPPRVLNHIGRFTMTLHKIHTFVEAQQKGSVIKKFLRQGEIVALLTDCKAGLRDAIEFFEIPTLKIMTDITEMQEHTQKRHREVLDIVEAFSDATSSDGASSVRKIHCFCGMPIIVLQISRFYSGSHNSSNSISMLPSEPKIFHGRESELSDILRLFSQVNPKIAILGAGGMGKTSLAKAVIHHPEITVKYEQHRFFVGCDSATTKIELAALIGAHLGLKSGKDLTQPVVQHFSCNPPSLLILDNLETLWEPAESRPDVEEFLSLLTDVKHLALMITMRGAERPVKVAWTRPFLLPLQPLDQEAAHRTFIDIADNGHSPEEVNEVLSLTDNMPLVISLLAHLVDAEGCSAVLSRWAEEKTSLISDGFDKRSNLDLSISLSLSSPRIEYLPHSQDLLSLLSMLPDGLSETELMQSKLPINNILGCKAALIRTALAYNDEHKQLKMLGPIREYMQKMKPPGYHLIHPLLKHFQELLEFYVENHGAQLGSSIVGRISSNLANIQSVLQKGLQPGHADLKDTIYCMCHLNQISRHIGCKGPIALIAQVHGMLPQLRDPHLEAYFITELLASWRYYPISNHKTLVSDSLKNVEQVDDTDLKCRFYSRIADYYQIHMQDLSTAIHFSQMVVSLGISSGNTKWQSQGLYDLAKHTWFLGDYSACKVYAHESQKLARISADLFREALALHFEAICLYTLGDYQQSTPLFDRARVLVELCGVSGGALDRNIMSDQAEVYKLKSEYIEARNIHTGLLQVTPLGQDPYKHAFALLNIAEIDVLVGAPAQNAQTNIQTARELFHARGLGMEVTYCEAILADLCLREGDIQVAGSLLEKCIKSRPQPTIMSYCLERLGDVNRWNISHHASSWTILYLVYSLKCKEKLGIHKALQFLGDMFHAYEDAETAISLYRVALEGFTAMDIHRSRAECMLRLGDISKGHSDLLKSVELWETARPLFERSSQTKQIESIDERLAGVRANILEQHHRNFTRLAEINAPSGTVDRLKDDLSDVDELEETGLDEARAVDPDAV